VPLFLLGGWQVVEGSKDQWEAGVWHMDKEQWDLLWTGEQAFWKTLTHLLAAGHRTAEALSEQRTVQGETESEPVGSRTDTVERGNVGVLVG
jgi:hypothetical protein